MKANYTLNIYSNYYELAEENNDLIKCDANCCKF